MAHVFRLIFAVLVTAFSLSVHALIPPVPAYSVPDRRGSAVAVYRGATANEACQASMPGWVATYGAGGWKNIRLQVESNDTVCVGYGQPGLSNPETDMGGSAITKTGTICPVNSTASGAQCQCTAPMIENVAHTACVPPLSSAEKWKKWCQDAAGKSLGPMEAPGRGAAGGCLSGINIVGSPIDTPGYQQGDVPDGGGCSFSFADSTSHVDGVPEPGKPYNWVTEGQGTVSGGTCMAGQAPVPTDAPPGTEQSPKGATDPCPNGNAGTVNGTPVCAKSDPTKGVEGTSTGTVKNADGTSKDTKKEIKCDNGRCTVKTTETTRDSAGNVLGTSVTEEQNTIGEVCNKQPGTKVCADVGMGDGEGGGGFSGNCVAGFVAKGEDPILNAMALEQHKRNCDMLRTDQEPSTWLTAEGQKTTDRTADNPNNKTVSLSASDIDTSDALGGGAHCIADKVVNVAGSSVLLPFSKVCGSLEMLGNVLLGVTLLAAAGIVLRG